MVDDLVDDLGHGVGRGRLGREDLQPLAGEVTVLQVDGGPLDAAAADVDAEGLSYEEWATRLQRYYRHLEDLIWPDLFVVGGGISRKAHKYLPFLELRTPIVPAELRNAAGIIGAALLASQTQESRGRHKA